MAVIVENRSELKCWLYREESQCSRTTACRNIDQRLTLAGSDALHPAGVAWSSRRSAGHCLRAESISTMKFASNTGFSFSVSLAYPRGLHITRVPFRK